MTLGPGFSGRGQATVPNHCLESAQAGRSAGSVKTSPSHWWRLAPLDVDNGANELNVRVAVMRLAPAETSFQVALEERHGS